MRVAVAAAAVLLASCQRTATEDALIAKAQKTAFLPDCASLRVGYSRQIHFPDDPEIDNLVVIYRASSQCMDKWQERLDASGWRPEHHGGWSSPSDRIFAGTHRAGRANEGVVIWYQRAFEPGVQDISQDAIG